MSCLCPFGVLTPETWAVHRYSVLQMSFTKSSKEVLTSNVLKRTNILSLCSLVVLYIGRRAFGNRNAYPLPPGPPGLPWIGTVIGIDASAPWKTYAEWARTYGGIIYTQLFGKDIIIVNSEKIAKDLLEKRSRNYSDRPCLITPEMCGLAFNTVLMPYGDRWRLHRQFFHQTFRLEAVPRFLPLQHRKACHLLRQLFDAPEQLNDHLFEYTVSVVLNSTYDYDPASRSDELVNIAANVLEIVVPAVRPDVAIMIGTIPLLHRLPPWFPGMSFKRKMAAARIFSKEYLERPFEYSVQRVRCGSIAPSMVSDALLHIEKKRTSPKESWMQALKEASGTAFLAASETSHSVLMTFFLLMVLNPATQEKAQAQIDSIVGTARLPTIDDRALLPFVDAILWETIRYNPSVPLSIPHVAVDDDVYDGFRIPKGAILLANQWSMAHDETRFPDPNAFIPERFLNDDGSLKPNEIEHIAFGFGRRICVGRHLGEASVWAVITKFLAVFKILNALDENGVEIPVEPRFSSGLVIHPLPFKYRIIPRFPGMDTQSLEQLIAATAA